MKTDSTETLWNRHQQVVSIDGSGFAVGVDHRSLRLYAAAPEFGRWIDQQRVRPVPIDTALHARRAEATAWIRELIDRGDRNAEIARAVGGRR